MNWKTHNSLTGRFKVILPPTLSPYLRYPKNPTAMYRHETITMEVLRTPFHPWKHMKINSFINVTVYTRSVFEPRLQNILIGLLSLSIGSIEMGDIFLIWGWGWDKLMLNYGRNWAFLGLELWFNQNMF